MAKPAYKILEDIFTNQINVLNIAVPITPLDHLLARDVCLKNNYDVHLVKEPGKEDLQVYVKHLDSIRPLWDSEIISERTPLIEVIDIVCIKEQVFVKVKRDITHIVTRSDLDTIPLRIWLYGMLSIFEIELKERINQLGIKWEQNLSVNRFAKVKELYQLKKSKNEEINLLGCTQLVDVGTIIFKSLEHFQDIFPSEFSKKKIQSCFNNINNLRDALAHGQKLLLEWSEILSLIKLISYSLGKI